MWTTLGLGHMQIFVLLGGGRSVAWLGAAALPRAACAVNKNGDSVPASRSASGFRTGAAGTAPTKALWAAREVSGSLWARGRWIFGAGSKLCASAQPMGPYPKYPLRGGSDGRAFSMPDAGGMPFLTVAGRAVPPRARCGGRGRSRAPQGRRGLFRSAKGGHGAAPALQLSGPVPAHASRCRPCLPCRTCTLRPL